MSANRRQKRKFIRQYYQMYAKAFKQSKLNMLKGGKLRRVLDNLETESSWSLTESKRFNHGI